MLKSIMLNTLTGYLKCRISDLNCLCSRKCFKQLPKSRTDYYLLKFIRSAADLSSTSPELYTNTPFTNVELIFD